MIDYPSLQQVAPQLNSHLVDWTVETGFTLDRAHIKVRVGSSDVRIGCYCISAIAFKRIVDQAIPLLFPPPPAEKELY
jgi:hypothetical protein